MLCQTGIFLLYNHTFFDDVMYYKYTVLVFCLYKCTSCTSMLSNIYFVCIVYAFVRVLYVGNVETLFIYKTCHYFIFYIQFILLTINFTNSSFESFFVFICITEIPQITVQTYNYFVHT